MSRHPTPPLPFHLFSSPSSQSLASNLAQGRLGSFRLPKRQQRARRGACPQDVGEALGAFTPAPPPGLGTRPAERDEAGRPWPERRGGRAGRATPETAGLRGGSLTPKVTGPGETTGPRRSRGHRSSRNPTGAGVRSPARKPGGQETQRGGRHACRHCPPSKGRRFTRTASRASSSPQHTCGAAGVHGGSYGDCRRSGVTPAAAAFASAETWEAAGERGGQPSGRGPGLGMRRGRPPSWRLRSERPQRRLPAGVCGARAAAPLHPRLALLPRVCLTLDPSAAAAGRRIPGGANAGAGPQPRAVGSAPPPAESPGRRSPWAGVSATYTGLGTFRD